MFGCEIHLHRHQAVVCYGDDLKRTVSGQYLYIVAFRSSNLEHTVPVRSHLYVRIVQNEHQGSFYGVAFLVYDLAFHIDILCQRIHCHTGQHRPNCYLIFLHIVPF